MARTALRGYKRNSDGRSYRTPAGKTITRREYENRLARARGYPNAYQLEKWARSAEYEQWAFDARRHGFTGDQGRDSQFMHDAYEVYRQIQVHGVVELEGYTGPADETPLGRLLIAWGKIPADEWWNYAE